MSCSSCICIRASKYEYMGGQIDSSQMELMQGLLQSGDTLVLDNKERIVLPDNLHFIWEVSHCRCCGYFVISNQHYNA